MPKLPIRRRTILFSKSIFVLSLLIIFLTTSVVWIYGQKSHRTILENTFWSTSILAFVLFLFLLTGLYKGIKIKDNLGAIVDRFSWKKIDNIQSVNFLDGEAPEFGDDIASIILGIIIWIIASIIIGFLFWIFAGIIWMTFLVFAAMLYWIFFRAMRLVFKKSSTCKGQFDRSLMYAVFYTFIYTFWIYGILYFVGFNNLAIS